MFDIFRNVCHVYYILQLLLHNFQPFWTLQWNKVKTNRGSISNAAQFSFFCELDILLSKLRISFFSDFLHKLGE